METDSAMPSPASNSSSFNTNRALPLSILAVSISVLKPPLPTMVSRPLPPVRKSSFVVPVKVSSPAPPSILTVPEKPAAFIILLPEPPYIIASLMSESMSLM